MNTTASATGENTPNILYTKLSRVMGAIDNVPKRGTNTFHNYSYATEADISTAIRGELVKQNVALIPNYTIKKIKEIQTTAGKTTYLTYIDLALSFYCGDTGQVLTCAGVGVGEDPGDKGVYKAVTGGIKYLLMKMFLVPTGDDPERTPAQSNEPTIMREQWANAKPAAPASETGGFLWPFGEQKGYPLHEVSDNSLTWFLNNKRPQPGSQWYQKNAEQYEQVRAEAVHRKLIPELPTAMVQQGTDLDTPDPSERYDYVPGEHEEPAPENYEVY